MRCEVLAFRGPENDIAIGCVLVLWIQRKQNPINANGGWNQQKEKGKLLVNELLSFCKSNGIKEVVCHSRENAAFYLNLGYEIYDEPFIEVGIKHSHMRINLN
jgi:hypothetical protein